MEYDTENKEIEKESDYERLHLAEFKKQEGKDMYEKEKYLEAFDSFSQCVDVCPSDWHELPGVLGNRAATLMMLERFVEVITDCDRALGLMPTNLRLLDRKGRAQLKLGLHAEADSTFQLMLKGCEDSALPGHSKTNNLIKDANSGINSVVEVRLLLGKLDAYTVCNTNLEKVMKLADDLLVFCPSMRLAQSYKVQFLCHFCRWDEAKRYAEEKSLDVHDSIRTMFAHANQSLGGE